MIQKLDNIRGTYSPTYPENVSGFGADPTTYSYSASVVEVRMNFKIENVTQTGFAGRISIPHNIPNKYCPSYVVHVVGQNGEASGYTLASMDLTNITIYPMKTGTTYLQATVVYLADGVI